MVVGENGIPACCWNQAKNRKVYVVAPIDAFQKIHATHHRMQRASYIVMHQLTIYSTVTSTKYSSHDYSPVLVDSLKVGVSNERAVVLQVSAPAT